MSILFYIANACLIPPAMFFTVNYYRYRGKEIKYNKLYVTIAIILVTTLITSLQFIFPNIIPILGRNKEALLSGEVWRLITPLFIQPSGIWQCVFNGVFLIAFLPLAEYFYRRKLILIYFIAGIAGQAANFYWNKGVGGSSTAIFGVLGALFTYVLFTRKNFPPQYIYLAIIPFIGAVILLFFKDGHAIGLLTGAGVAFAINSKKLVVST